MEDCCGAFDPRWHEQALNLINGPQTMTENHHKSVGLYFGEVAALADVERDPERLEAAMAGHLHEVVSF